MGQEHAGPPVRISYWANHRQALVIRNIMPERIWFGSTAYHPEPQWILDARDVDRGVERQFAMQDIWCFNIDRETPSAQEGQ